ncbi:Asp23/Gls24 family envelope stress response protein [Ferroacidibacillus organovorans]|uniref:Alkaline-shock protein n=1 Tax=Ferroacidibacillus organovorans TaxID=1765683 RepID=A0A161QG31_9BACL|nr:Asp23/Gls24 family envelope stress response protein [Ferroacidibacillus organovorans]KYP81000.1 alkaline-shock protein [Ferroacidibacillus organovorans]OAG94295.1 alkaline-shock protein [Ferroacidibacillus organovorans]OPG16465.1 alkaline-shock protein [Ferroacidibacillus organovorans]
MAIESGIVHAEDTGLQGTGTTQIANEVIAVIAGLAATEVRGVSDMSGGIVGGIAERLGRKNLSKGVRVDVTPDEQQCTIDLAIIAEYGYRIPDVAREIQEGVKRAIESMTGLEVLGVNVSVLGISFRVEERTDEEKVRV